ncbi:hypothetical protein [Microbacterium saperdae]|nr:hypothetical protein [Microbacterium saperdae]GGM63108.1 hypothetical protein GCM10010489_38230 [Microbacterium saperdae]
MDGDLEAMYRIRLRSLMWAAGLLKELRHSRDVEAVAVAANWGLDAAYDLFEAYIIAKDIQKNMKQDDALLASTAGEVVGGLMFVRGEKTHRARRVDAPSPFKDLPYDFAGLTDWTWSKLTTRPTASRYTQRAEWYQRHVQDRPLWAPLESAEYWFLKNWPTEVPRSESIETPDWVDGVRPFYDSGSDA